MSDEPRPRRDRRGRVALGPTWWARTRPFVRYGAPLLAVFCYPVSSVIVMRFAMSDGLGYLWDQPWRAIAALLGGWAALSSLMALTLRLVHRTAWWDPATRTLRRGRARVHGDAITLVWADFRPQGVSLVQHGAAEGSNVAENGSVAIPVSGWDTASFDGLRWLQRELGLASAPPLARLRADDRLARQRATNRTLAVRYQMPWREEWDDPHVFLEAFDDRRRALGRERR